MLCQQLQRPVPGLLPFINPISDMAGAIFRDIVISPPCQDWTYFAIKHRSAGMVGSLLRDRDFMGLSNLKV
jgi:hypothetical protein